MNAIATLLGLCKKAGRIAIGEEPVGAACRGREAALVIIASDTAENSHRRAAHFAEAGRVPALTIPLDKGELGRAVGRSSCAMAAITDAGFAAALVKKLAAEDPAQYEEAHAQLEVKATRILARQKEKRAHEKNLLRKKKRYYPKGKPKT